MLMRPLRWAGYGIAGVLLFAVAAVWFRSSRKMSARIAPQPSRLTAPSAQELADGPRHVTDIAGMLDIPAVNVSHHLNVLTAATLIRREKAGRFVY